MVKYRPMLIHSMFESDRKNMSKDQMKSAASMMANMSDDDLRNYAKMAGWTIFHKIRFSRDA